MSALEILSLSQKSKIKDSGDYITIYIGGLPYRIPKEKYEKMKVLK